MDNLSVELYRKLYTIRRAEEWIIENYSKDDMKTPMHMSLGQEAIASAVCHALGPEGQVFGSYRSHAGFLAKTGDVDRFFGELYGKVAGTAQGKSGSMHLAAPEQGYVLSSAIVASSIPVAVGAAFANKRKENGQVSCAFFGDGALDEGVFWESLNVACVMELPVLLVCEDNDLAANTPKNLRQGYRRITDVIRTFNCRVFEDDTTDVEQIHGLAREAIQSIKRTGIPSFLHLQCYRYLEHVGVYEGLRRRLPFQNRLRGVVQPRLRQGPTQKAPRQRPDRDGRSGAGDAH